VRILFLCILLTLVGWTPVAAAPTGINQVTMFGPTVVPTATAPNGTATTAFNGSSKLSAWIYTDGNGTSPNFTIFVKVTMDGVNYFAPDTTNTTVATITDNNQHLVDVSLPNGFLGVTVNVSNNSATKSVTPTVLFVNHGQ